MTWQGERREQLRAAFTIRDGQPVVQELAARKEGGGWIALAGNLTSRVSDHQRRPTAFAAADRSPERARRRS